MGHSPHQPAVLEDGRAAHTLDNAAGLLQQPGVRDLQHQVPGVRGVAADLLDLHGIFLHGAAHNISQNGGAALVDLLGRGHGNGLAGERLGIIEMAKDPAFCVGKESSQVLAGGKSPPKLPGAAVHALHDV